MFGRMVSKWIGDFGGLNWLITSMDMTQWAVVAVVFVIVGFMALRPNCEFRLGSAMVCPILDARSHPRDCWISAAKQLGSSKPNNPPGKPGGNGVV